MLRSPRPSPGPVKRLQKHQAQGRALPPLGPGGGSLRFRGWRGTGSDGSSGGQIHLLSLCRYPPSLWSQWTWTGPVGLRLGCLGSHGFDLDSPNYFQESRFCRRRHCGLVKFPLTGDGLGDWGRRNVSLRLV